ncbi:hypothetical protein RMR21_008150 [Agrobacterium sp. rho-8.1]|nr:hypothetical protein [Agrobacterium sp. rho-8.1]
MNVHVNTIEAFLDALVAELEIHQYRYDQAERSFKSLGEWLQSQVTKTHFSPSADVRFIRTSF